MPRPTPLTVPTVSGVIETTIQSGTVVTIAGEASDNSTNSTSKLPVLAGVANAAAPAWIEGREVPLSSDLNGQLRVVAGSAAGSLTNRSTVIPNPAASVIVIPPGARYWEMQNPSDGGESLWWCPSGAAAAGDANSFELPVGGMIWYEAGVAFPNAIQVFGATPGHEIKAFYIA